MTDCLVCQENSGEVEVPGGFLHSDEWTIVFHALPFRSSKVYPGHLLITSRRHALDYADLRDDEAASVGREIAKWSRALKSVGAERVYVAAVGHGFPHLHVNLLPRWPGTPDDVPWYAVDDWTGAARVGFAEAEALASRLRTFDDT
jgi:histidine triad (HIT) family protein